MACHGDDGMRSHRHQSGTEPPAEASFSPFVQSRADATSLRTCPVRQKIPRDRTVRGSETSWILNLHHFGSNLLQSSMECRSDLIFLAPIGNDRMDHRTLDHPGPRGGEYMHFRAFSCQRAGKPSGVIPHATRLRSEGSAHQEDLPGHLIRFEKVHWSQGKIVSRRGPPVQAAISSLVLSNNPSNSASQHHVPSNPESLTIQRCPAFSAPSTGAPPRVPLGGRAVVNGASPFWSVSALRASIPGANARKPAHALG